MFVWVKTEGAMDSEAFKLWVDGAKNAQDSLSASSTYVAKSVSSVAATPNAVGATSHSDRAEAPPISEAVHEPAAEASSVTVRDVLRAAYVFFLNGPRPISSLSPAAVVAAEKCYDLVLRHHCPLKLDDDVDTVVTEALNAALDVNKTVTNREGTTLRFTLLRRIGVVFELRRREEAIVTPVKKRISQARRSTDRPVDPAASPTTASAPPGHDSSIAAVVTPPSSQRQHRPSKHTNPIHQPPCATFAFKWNVPDVCAVCLHQRSAHEIKGSGRGAAAAGCSNADSPAPHSPINLSSHRKRSALFNGSSSPGAGASNGEHAPATSAYKKTCAHFLPLWDHNQYCANCYRLYSWHSEFAESQAFKQHQQQLYAEYRRAVSMQQRRVREIPWSVVYNFLTVEDIMICAAVCKTTLSFARTLLRNIMEIVLRAEPPRDLAVHALRDASTIAATLSHPPQSPLARAVLIALQDVAHGGSHSTRPTRSDTRSSASLLSPRSKERPLLTFVDAVSVGDLVRAISTVDALRMDEATVSAIGEALALYRRCGGSSGGGTSAFLPHSALYRSTTSFRGGISDTPPPTSPSHRASFEVDANDIEDARVLRPVIGLLHWLQSSRPLKRRAASYLAYQAVAV